MQRTFRYIISAILALVALSCDKLRDDTYFKYIPIPVPEMISARISALEQAMKSSGASGLIEDAPESWDDMEGVVTRTYAVADPNTIDPETGEVILENKREEIERVASTKTVEKMTSLMDKTVNR